MQNVHKLITNCVVTDKHVSYSFFKLLQCYHVLMTNLLTLNWTQNMEATLIVTWVTLE
jgi:hypothetical protein